MGKKQNMKQQDQGSGEIERQEEPAHAAEQ